MKTLIAFLLISTVLLAAEEVRIDKGVAYLPADREELADLYFPAVMPKDAVLPAVVMIHGGGWNGGRRDAKRELNVGTTLASNGYVCMSIDYKLARGTQAVWPQNLHDCKTAVRWLRQNADHLGINPERIGSWAVRRAGTWHQWSPSPRPGTALIHRLLLATPRVR